MSHGGEDGHASMTMAAPGTKDIDRAMSRLVPRVIRLIGAGLGGLAALASTVAVVWQFWGGMMVKQATLERELASLRAEVNASIVRIDRALTGVPEAAARIETKVTDHERRLARMEDRLQAAAEALAVLKSKIKRRGGRRD